jgi:excisionase family DNA binding protein
MLTDAHSRVLLTVAEVAQRTRTHPMTVRRWILTGQLAAIQLGGKGSAVRVEQDALDVWLDRQRTRGTEA